MLEAETISEMLDRIKYLRFVMEHEILPHETREAFGAQIEMLNAAINAME